MSAPEATVVAIKHARLLLVSAAMALLSAVSARMLIKGVDTSTGGPDQWNGKLVSYPETPLRMLGPDFIAPNAVTAHQTHWSEATQEAVVSRGDFDFICRSQPYSSADKDWHVELVNCTYLWFDTIIDPLKGFDTAGLMRSYLQGLSELVRGTLDKHFVYYLASRVKVRFSTRKKPRYGIFDKLLIFYLEIGRARRLKKYAIQMRDTTTGEIIRPKVEVTDRYITFYNEVGGKQTESIYDFLESCGIETGINSEIQYVGYTKNPEQRPFDRDHRGFADMLHWTSRNAEDYDYFIFYNLFKVLSIASNRGFNFVIANAMTDEVNVRDEALVLEKVLIKYFGAKPQELNMERESSELHNRLEDLAAIHKIKSITFDLSLERSSELFRFYSRTIKPADRHHFSCRIGKLGAEIVPPKDLDFIPSA
jgi:hypothetical protein